MATSEHVSAVRPQNATASIGSGNTMRPGRSSSRRTVSWNCICCRIGNLCPDIFAYRSSVLPKEARLTPTSQSAQRLRQLESGTTTEAALAFFDALPPVELATLIGSWRGKGLETGHPMDGLLERFGWHGKRFTGPDGAHPLVFEPTKGGVFSVNPAMIPVGFVLRHADLFRHPLAARLFRVFGAVLRTDQPKARLRMTEHRGVVSAAMIYDFLPINDIFRKVDDDTVLGVMDLRYTPQPLFFVLRREGQPGTAEPGSDHSVGWVEP